MTNPTIVNFTINFRVTGAEPNMPFDITINSTPSDSGGTPLNSDISDSSSSSNYLKVTSPLITVQSIIPSNITSGNSVSFTNPHLGSTTILIDSQGNGTGSMNVTAPVSGDYFDFIINGLSTAFQEAVYVSSERRKTLSIPTLFATGIVVGLLYFLLRQNFLPKKCNAILAKNVTDDIYDEFYKIYDYILNIDDYKLKIRNR